MQNARGMDLAACKCGYVYRTCGQAIALPWLDCPDLAAIVLLCLCTNIYRTYWHLFDATGRWSVPLLRCGEGEVVRTIESLVVLDVECG